MKNIIHPVDKHVGNRIRVRRIELNYSQGDLADALGVTFQQVQKYENGTNRVSASRLWDIAKELKGPTAYFFEGIDDQSEESHATLDQLGKAGIKFAVMLNQLNPEQRRAILILVENLADKGNG